MNPSDRSDVKALQTRVIELEELLTHHQHTVSQLDEIVAEQAKRIDDLQKRYGQLDGKLDGLQDQLVEQRDVEDEKPPHY